VGFQLDAKTKAAVPIDMAALQTDTNLGFSMAGDTVDPPGGLRSAPLPGRRTIAGHSCEGHRIRGQDVRLDVWVARSVPVSVDRFTELLEWSGAAQSLGGLLPEIRKLRGFPLETRSQLTRDGHVYVSTATITQIKTDALSPSLFEVPEGYRTAEPAP
jgi:hypothetical protein